jgi:hypothetical protein
VRPSGVATDLSVDRDRHLTGVDGEEFGGAAACGNGRAGGNDDALEAEHGRSGRETIGRDAGEKRERDAVRQPSPDHRRPAGRVLDRGRATGGERTPRSGRGNTERADGRRDDREENQAPEHRLHPLAARRRGLANRRRSIIRSLVAGRRRQAVQRGRRGNAGIKSQ